MKQLHPVLKTVVLMPGLFACTLSSPIDFSKSVTSEPEIEDSSTSESEVKESSSEIETPSFAGKKVLFVGNSFTYYNDIDVVAQSLADSLGMGITCEKLAKGSQRLSQTASSGDELGAQFDQKINNNHYDYIILQEQSTLPLNDYSSFVNGVKLLKAKIDAKLPDAKVFLYSTWGYASLAETRNCTIPEAEEALREAYRKCGADAGVEVSYAGKSFSIVYQTHPEINLYFTDDKHPSFPGTYLAAATHLASIFKVDIREAAFIGDESVYNPIGGLQFVSSDNAEILRNVAYEVANNLI